MAVRRLGPDDLENHPHLKPIRIARNSFGPNIPDRDLRVLPQHRVLVQGPQVLLNIGLEAALAPAYGLTCRPGVSIEAEATRITYVHVGLDAHHVLISNGMATESFLPGSEAISGLDLPLRAELIQIFPYLVWAPYRGIAPARPILRRQETTVIAHQTSGRA